MTNVKPNYEEIMKELFYQVSDTPDGFFSLLNVPTYSEERTLAYENLKKNLYALIPDAERKSKELAYEEFITEYEELCRLTAFKTGFMCAVALGKVSRMD